jgi:hypothetical protein
MTKTFLCLLSLMALPAIADPVIDPAVQQLKGQAKSIRLDADRTFAAKQEACAKRLIKLDNGCLDDARQSRNKALLQARKLEDQAADLEPIGDDERAALREEIAHVNAKAAAIKSDAERALKTRQAECYKKFLVNDCLDDTRDAKLETVEEAHDLEQLARDLERQLKKREIATRTLKRREKALQQEAEAAAKSASKIPTSQ